MIWRKEGRAWGFEHSEWRQCRACTSVSLNTLGGKLPSNVSALRTEVEGLLYLLYLDIDDSRMHLVAVGIEDLSGLFEGLGLFSSTTMKGILRS